MKPAESLARAPAFIAIAKHLGFGRDLAGWGKVSEIWPPPSDDAGQLVTMRKQTEEALKITQDERKAARLRARLRAIDEAAGRINSANAVHENGIGAIAAAAVGVDVEGGALKIKLAANLTRGTIVTRVITDRAAPLQILGALRDRPLLLVSAHAEAKALLAGLELWLQGRGIAFASVKDIYGKLTKGSFDADVVPLLTGEFGIAVTTSGPIQEVADMGKKGGAHLVIGVSSPAKAEAVLRKLADTPMLKMMSRKTKTGVRIKLNLPGNPPMHIGVAGNAIVATSDEDMFERFGTAGVGFADKLRAPELGKLIATRASAAIIVDALIAAPTPKQSGAGGRLIGPPPPDSKAPFSKDYEKAVKRVDELRKKLTEQRKSAVAKSAIEHIELTHKMGVLGVVLAGTEQGAVGYGGLYMGGTSASTAIGELATTRARLSQQRRIRDATVAAHQRELISAMQQVRKIRLRDIAEYELNKLPKKTKAPKKKAPRKRAPKKR
jgi:hypothetical protein